jgi:hypothetical protein
MWWQVPIIFSPLVHGLICVGKIDHHCGATMTLWQVPIIFFLLLLISFCVSRIDHHCGAVVASSHNVFLSYSWFHFV